MGGGEQCFWKPLILNDFRPSFFFLFPVSISLKAICQHFKYYFKGEFLSKFFKKAPSFALKIKYKEIEMRNVDCVSCEWNNKDYIGWKFYWRFLLPIQWFLVWKLRPYLQFNSKEFFLHMVLFSKSKWHRLEVVAYVIHLEEFVSCLLPQIGFTFVFLRSYHEGIVFWSGNGVLRV